MCSNSIKWSTNQINREQPLKWIRIFDYRHFESSALSSK